MVEKRKCFFKGGTKRGVKVSTLAAIPRIYLTLGFVTYEPPLLGLLIYLPNYGYRLTAKIFSIP